MSKDLITVANGKTVTLDEFLTWSVHKQRMNIVSVSAETRARISAANKGKNTWSKGRNGKPHSDETKAKIGVIHKGKMVSEETRAKLSAAMTGKSLPKSNATKAKIAAAKCKPITTPNGTFPSITAAAADYNVRGNVIQYRMKKYPNEYYFVARSSKEG